MRAFLSSRAAREGAGDRVTEDGAHGDRWRYLLSHALYVNVHNPGGWAVTLRKYRATWHWTCHNPEGGSFGSNQVGTKASALRRAMRGIPVGEAFVLITENEGRHVSTVTIVA